MYARERWSWPTYGCCDKQQVLDELAQFTVAGAHDANEVVKECGL